MISIVEAKRRIKDAGTPVPRRSQFNRALDLFPDASSGHGRKFPVRDLPLLQAACAFMSAGCDYKQLADLVAGEMTAEALLQQTRDEIRHRQHLLSESAKYIDLIPQIAARGNSVAA